MAFWLAHELGYGALKYLTYTVQVLLKCCKPIPVLLGEVIMGKRHPPSKYLSVALLVGGVVEDFETRSRSFSSVQFALEYEIRLRIEVEVTRPDGTVVPVDQGSFVESEIYFASADLEATRKNRTEALRRVADLVAERTADAVTLEADGAGEGAS